MHPASMIDIMWNKTVHHLGAERLWAGLSLVCGAGFLLFLIGNLTIAAFQPDFSFDLIAYIGSALSQSGLDSAGVHSQAWGQAQLMTSSSDYDALSNGDAYRQRQSSDASAFASVLPFYKVKVGYISLLGLAPSAASMAAMAFWTSLFAGLAIGSTMFIWMVRNRMLLAAPMIIGLLLLTHFYDQIRSPGPDIMASALILIGILCWLENRNWTANIVWLIAFLFRPDTLLLLLAVVLANYLFRQRQLHSLLTFAAALVLSILIQKTMNHPGWWVHYWFSTVSLQPTLVGFDPAFSIIAWGKGLARGIYMSLFEFNWLGLFALLSSLTAWMFYLGFEFTQRQRAALAIMAMTIGGKFILFPLPDDRLYAIFIIAGALILAVVARNGTSRGKDVPATP